MYLKLENLKVEQLWEKCKALDLDTEDTKLVLVERLTEHWHVKASFSAEKQEESESDANLYDAILVAQSELGDEEGMNRDAENALQQTLEEDELLVEEATSNGELWVGNRRDLNIATHLRESDHISSLRDKITSYEVKTTSLEERVRILTCSLDACKLLRNRFISTYKRDKLGSASDADRKIIALPSSIHRNAVAVNVQDVNSLVMT